MKAWVSILKTGGFSILLFVLLLSFFSWVLYPVFIPREYRKKSLTSPLK